jgi:hypothetical protein
VGSDLARVSFDPVRQYRSVVTQQGRVTLEADVNEASRIAAEALRLETIDLVGPAATPDNGYQVGLDANGDLSVGAGTMYLGGWRLRLDASVKLGAQPDWLDMPAAGFAQGVNLVALLASEQCVSAVEDTALREVALGGPDTAARSRLMQHFLFLPAGGRSCADAAGALVKLLAGDGVTLDPASDQLLSDARLQVGFAPPTAPPDPCQPAAVGGYLGADNQMIRVSVIAFDAVKRSGTLVWGWNNASVLYRASIDSPQTLSLSPAPIDAEHAPQQAQAVEILLTQADLGDGDLIASAQGSVVVLTQAYDPDTNLLTLPTGFTMPNTPRPLFVRLWQSVVNFTPGTPVALDDASGLTVTINMTALPTRVALRPFWHFAARPSTPVLVYPRRYLEAPQPPDGPRQWLCSLAVVTGFGKDLQVLDDCRNDFPRGGACCATVLGPLEVAAQGGLQAVLDGLAGAGGPAALSLQPGTYVLAAPLQLTAKHEWLTLEGCGDGVVLQADPGSIATFRTGMFSLQQAAGVTLRRLLLEMPEVVISTTGDVPQEALIGANAIGCTGLTIEACRFVFAPNPKATVIGVGLVASGDCQGLAVRRCEFACTTMSGTPARTILGVVVNTGAAGTRLDDAEISGNLFTGLGIAFAAFSGPGLGLVRCRDNRVRRCDGGLYFLSTGATAAGVLLDSPARAASDLPVPQPEDLLSLFDQVHRAVAHDPDAKPAAKARVAPEIRVLLDALAKDLTAAELGGDKLLVPVLHITGNDVELVAAEGTSLGLSFAGLDVVLTGPQIGQVLVANNRFATPSSGVRAALVTLRPGQAVISGNLFTQGIEKAATALPCLAVQVPTGTFIVMANVVHGQATVQPDRPAPVPPATSWEFLNAVG